MSFLSNVYKSVKDFYSEINSATLTGAIDVVVIEQEDGSYQTSPFHVRFGKLGVLKSKEKIVDIEINDEPVDIHMKLDDAGAAFFVEGVHEEDEEEEELPAHLVTSPLPTESERIEATEAEKEAAVRSLLTQFEEVEKELKIPVEPTEERLDVTDAKEEVKEEPKEEVSAEKKPQKTGRKKRKRRAPVKHSRSGSKTSLKEFESSTEPSAEVSSSGVFTMEDVDNDADDDDDTDETPSTVKTLPTPVPTTPVADEEEIENSFLGSRIIPRTVSDSERLHALIDSNDQQERPKFELPKERPISVNADFHYFSESELSPTAPQTRPFSPDVLSDSEVDHQRLPTTPSREESHESWKWGELPSTTTKTSTTKTVDTSKTSPKSEAERDTRKWSLFNLLRTSHDKEAVAAGGIYLEDLKDDEEMLSLYVGSRRVDDDAESGNGPSLPMSPHSVEGAIGGNRPVSYHDSSDDEHKNVACGSTDPSMADIDMSLCGSLETEQFSSTLFEHSKISYDDFVSRLQDQGPKFFENPALVVRIGDQYFNWQSACPIIMTNVLFRRPLPSELVNVIKGSYQEPKKSSDPKDQKASSSGIRSWFSWGGSQANLPSPQTKAGESTEVTVEIKMESTEVKVEETPPKKTRFDSHNSTTSSEDSENEKGKGKYKKTLRLSSEALVKLNLKYGANEAQFSVTTAYQGTSRCKCHIYLWKYTDKIVISDVDGTITKSDVLGHIVPIFGRDWAQSGVASLFTKIKSNGYHIVYLSARAIGQASITKDYLSSIRQGDLCLPDGPLFLNPTSLINAFHREVIEKKPEEFKIACLRDIQNLFPKDRNPFYAGYGNRVNDAYAYNTVGIPISRIFTINYKGELRHELTQTFQTSYLGQSADVDKFYPSVSAPDTSPLRLLDHAPCSSAPIDFVGGAKRVPFEVGGDDDVEFGRKYSVYEDADDSPIQLTNGDDFAFAYEDELLQFEDALSRKQSAVRINGDPCIR